MENKKQEITMLDLMQQPAFRVENGVITQVNAAATGYCITPGQPVASLLSLSREDYATFNEGYLYLPLSIDEQVHCATVMKVDGGDTFVLESPQDPCQFQALALAAKELRIPLAGLMTGLERIVSQDCTAQAQETATQLQRRIMQMHRIINNMSDCSNTASSDTTELIDLCRPLEEILSKSAHALQSIGITLNYSIPTQPIYTLANQQKLERAVYNLISNAAKFSPAGGLIQADVRRNGNRVAISIADQGNGVTNRADIFTRYLRHPALEDSRNGIGLGMVFVRAAAIAHGGTVLVDQPENGGTRVTMTISICESKHTQVRSPKIRFDYAGEQDHCLLELSDVLPAHLYAPQHQK